MKLYIKEVAKKYGINIVELAEKLQVNRVSLSHTINNPNIKVSTLEKIADAIGCSVVEFYTGVSQDNNGHFSRCPHCGKQIHVKCIID